MRKQFTVVCRECGVTFTKRVHRTGDPPPVFCSRACRWASGGLSGAERAALALGHDDAASAIRVFYHRETLNVGDVAARLGVGRQTVLAIMRANGIRQRTAAEQKAIDLRHMDYDARMAMTAASRSVITGKRRSHDDLCRRALGKQRKAILSDDEAEIMGAFYEAGLHPVPLFAIDKYNVDFAFPDARLAVEYHGGNWHNTRKKREADADKARFLAAAGWTLLVFPRLYRPLPYKVRGGNKSVKLDALVAKVERTLNHLSPPVRQSPER